MIKEIIEKHCNFNPSNGNKLIVEKDFIYVAADLQKYFDEEMIKFAEWAEDNAGQTMEIGRWFLWMENRYLTSAELLEEYKKTLI